MKVSALFVSVLITAYTGWEYFENKEVFVSVVSDITLGEKTYSIYQSDTCVGEATVDFSRPNDELWTLLVSGYLSVARIGEIKLEWELSFNSIGQLGASLFNGSVGDIRFRGGTLGVKPMRIILREPQDLEFPYRGPVLLQKNGDLYSLALPMKRSIRVEESPFKVLEKECINKGEANLFNVTIPQIFKK